MDALIDGLEAALPPDLRDLYARHFAGERRLLGKIRAGAAPPDTVARAVERVLTRRRARPRTFVGRDARMIAAMGAVLPARRLDAVWLRGIGMRDGSVTTSPATAPADA
jgi:hypothetical protein